MHSINDKDPFGVFVFRQIACNRKGVGCFCQSYYEGGVWRIRWDDEEQSDLPSLKLIDSHLTMDGWKMNFLLGQPIFRGHFGFREGNQHSLMQYLFAIQ